MSKSHFLRWSLLSALVLSAGMVVLGAAEARPSGFMGVAKPSKESNVTFAMAGKIAEIMVTEGDEISEKQLIARLDDVKELAALKIAEHKASSEVSIRAEEAVRNQKQSDYERLVRAGTAVSDTERQAAKLEVVVADARIELARHTHQEDILQLDLQKVAVGMTKLTSPIGGVVQSILVKRGESTDGVSRPVIRVIQNDPLFVEVPVPIARAHRLKKGDAADVYFDPTDHRAGRVLLVFPNVDTGSQTILVRIEVANPQKTQSGGIVYVNFGQNVVQK